MVNERARTILRDLEQTLLQFVRKHKITHDEYRCATEILVGSVKAGEESLLYDVFIEAAATDADNTGNRGGLRAIEGPFYLPNAPALETPYVLPQRSDEAGAILFFSGRVISPDGAPVAGAELDMWHADAQGFYSNIHPGIPNGICAVVFGPLTMDFSRSGRLFPRRMRFRRMARPESSLELLAGISFARLTCM